MTNNVEKVGATLDFSHLFKLTQCACVWTCSRYFE